MSTLRLTTISNQTGSSSVPSDTVINGSAKAWVNFNGTGTVAIRASFNVSSITDNNTGDYTLNFTAAMADTNYAGIGSAGSDVASGLIEVNGTKTTTTQRVLSKNGTNNTTADQSLISVAIFR